MVFFNKNQVTSNLLSSPGLIQVFLLISAVMWFEKSQFLSGILVYSFPFLGHWMLSNVVLFWLQLLQHSNSKTFLTVRSGPDIYIYQSETHLHGFELGSPSLWWQQLRSITRLVLKNNSIFIKWRSYECLLLCPTVCLFDLSIYLSTRVHTFVIKYLYISVLI